MTPLERLREAAAVPADDVTVSRTDLAAVLDWADEAMSVIEDQRELTVSMLATIEAWAEKIDRESDHA